MKVVIFNDDSGGVRIGYPIDGDIQTVHNYAKKIVPQGQPYKIANAEDIPADRSQRGAWVVDPDDLTDGVGE